MHANENSPACEVEMDEVDGALLEAVVEGMETDEITPSARRGSRMKIALGILLLILMSSPLTANLLHEETSSEARSAESKYINFTLLLQNDTHFPLALIIANASIQHGDRRETEIPVHGDDFRSNRIWKNTSDNVFD
jgi:hypothetical protein